VQSKDQKKKDKRNKQTNQSAFQDNKKKTHIKKQCFIRSIFNETGVKFSDSVRPWKLKDYLEKVRY